MAIRHLKYRLDEEPVTGTVRLVAVPESVPHSAPDAPSPAAPDEPAEPVRAAEVAEWVELAVGAGCGPDGGGLGPEARFSFSRLPDGASLLCHTVDAGRGVRAIHLTGPEAARFVEEWPVTLLATGAVRGSGGSGGSGSVGDSGDSGDSGDAGDFRDSGDEIPGAGGPFAREQLVAFARAHEHRVAPFLADVRRLFDDPAGRQLVVAEESPDTVARWIALACASLPPSYVPSLTFATRAADPGRAPQHIVGIGPDAAFDRYDATALAHHYRVHDGLGGPGSPPLTDVWATWTARLWTAGVALPGAGTSGAEASADASVALRGPEASAEDSGAERDPKASAEANSAESDPEPDPFSPSRLVPPLLQAGLLSAEELAALPADQARAAVDALVTLVVTAPVSDDGPLPGLVALCEDLHAHAPAAAAPLALALARRRLNSVAPPELSGELAAVCAELPLSDDTKRALRAEYGGDADKALRRALLEPPAAWVEPLRIAFAVGADGGRGLTAAMSRLARDLRDTDDRARAAAVHVLEEVGLAPLTRRVLKLLGDESGVRRLDLLRDLAASEHGDWLRRHLDENSPLPLRLAEAAARWHGRGDGLRGFELFSRLTELLPERQVTDAQTLELVWRLVWRSGAPAPAELPRVVRACTVRLLVQARLGRHVKAVVTAPERVDQETVSFARELLHDPHLKRSERATASLLILAQDLADHRVSLPQGVHQLRALQVDAEQLADSVRHGVGRYVALALVRAPADQLARSPLYRYLISSGPELLKPYRQFMLDEGKRDELDHALPRQPAEICAYYFLWRPARQEGVDPYWRKVSEELLREILVPVVRGLDERALSDVATVIANLPEGENRLREWNAWRDSLREG
ncbi:GTPase-associated protein 1-related protein [Streptomyces lasiicapitis]|uniref:HEAT repeat domain-containing protein n=1 Tax=Streptomyces lasiicapitis TaxID=1923961 RepID=A0ABQ2LLB6_9ACTN|nr:GTPase-associated protein 1-related protein [Streptomyces lasiicapitis]GGO39119.1 hypothetical protein GCM10012286_15140 [Streptomyces lasiicapitis]